MKEDVKDMRTENVELTVLCLIRRKDEYLLQERVSKVWHGVTLPRGHIEPNESIIDAVRREIKEETGLTIYQPHLCGVKQFPIENGRYIVFLFKTDSFDGELKDSHEGKMKWVHKDILYKEKLVNDFYELIEVMLNDKLTEFQYVKKNDDWEIVMK